MVLTFPTRNIANSFSEYSDAWLSNSTGWFVVVVASLMWACALNYAVRIVRGEGKVA
jgi:hypothetical protein